MELLVFFAFLMFYVLSVGECSIFDDQFPQNSSRLADDWLPVAQCRADCLNGFGWAFGITTILKCNSLEGCLSCWNDCACQSFHPMPLWPQCSMPSTCFAGCRRARSFYATTKISSVQNVTNTWRLLSIAKLFDGITFFINNTLVDDRNRPYKKVDHLVFSVAILDGADWTQLTQSVTFTTALNIDEAAALCNDGCQLRTVAVNGSSVLAESFFTYIARQNVNIPVNSTLVGDDSTLSIILPWKPLSAAWNNVTNGSYELAWFRTNRSSVGSDIDRRSNDTGRLVFDGDIPIPSFLMTGLTYNSVYNATITRNASTASVSFQYHFETPFCAQTDASGLLCFDDWTAMQGPPKTSKNEVQFSAVAIGCTVVALLLVCGICLYLALQRWRRLMRKDERAVRMSRLTQHQRSVIIANLTRPPATQNEVDRLLTPNFSDIIPNGTFVSNQHYLVTEGTFGGHRLAVKRLNFCKDDVEKKQRMLGLSTEVDVLTTLRHHSNFVRLLGTAKSLYGVVVLTKFEENAWPLNTFLNKFYRSPQIIGRDVGRTGCSLGPGAFGAPGAAFLRNLTGADMLAMAVQVASGLAYLNSRKIIHGALCAGNVLCNADFQVKIHGLSNTSYLDETVKKVLYNDKYNRWLPLEVLKQRAAGVGMKTDVWSFGVFLWEMLTLGSLPYPRNDVEWLIHFLETGNRLEQSPLCSNEVYQFIISCWAVNVAARPSMLEVHERIRSISQRRESSGGDLIKLSEVGELRRMADVAGSYASTNLGSEDFDDSVFASSEPVSYSTVGRSTSQENLMLSEGRAHVGSLQRMKEKFGTWQTGFSHSPNPNRSTF